MESPRNFYVIEIEKYECRRQDLTRIRNHLEEMKRLGKVARMSTVIVFPYDDDEREVYAIPEVRAYIKKLSQDIPWFWYFTMPLGMSYVFACLINNFTALRLLRVPDVNISLDLSELDQLLEIMRCEILKMANKLSDSDGDTVIKQWESLITAS